MISKTGYLKSALLLLSALSLNTWGQADLKHSIVKNVIVLIADGCGFNHLEATACYQNGNSGPLPFEHDFMKLAVSTYPAGGSYDPQAAWSDFNYVKQGPTDSAAAATAMATGVKTRNGTLGLDPAGNPLENVVAKAEKMGKATGVVTTVMFSHATPAAFVVHNYDRGKYDLIAQEMLLKSPLEVIMGTGHPWYDDNGVKKAGDDLSPPENVPEGDYRYVGGSDLWKQLSNGIVGGDCDGDAKPDPWTMIQSPGDFLKLTNGDTPKRVLGVAQVEVTLQQERTSVDGNAADDNPGQTPPLKTVPTLAEMTRAALNVLDNDPDGLFLMVEGGAIDWASHDHQLGRLIEETMDFVSAIEAVAAWVEANSNWNETLVVITADHETGYLTGPGSNPDWKPVQNNGKGKLPGVEWFTDEHTNSLVPLYVRGAGADAFKKAATHTDPKRGKYLDNTDIGKIIGTLLSK